MYIVVFTSSVFVKVWRQMLIPLSCDIVFNISLLCLLHVVEYVM